MEKKTQLLSQINTLHSSKMYNAAICEWQHQMWNNRRDGDFADNKTSTAVSSAAFLVCFGWITCVGLDSSCCQLKKEDWVLPKAYDKEAVFSANS